MHVTVYTDANAFDALREEWDGLLERSFGDTLFYRPAWLKAWWQVFGPEGGLRLIAVRDEGGRLTGVAPLFLGEVMADGSERVPNLSFDRPDPVPSATAHRALLLVGGTEVSDYLDLVVDRSHGPAVYEAIFHAVQHEVDGWEWLDLHCLPEGSPTPAALSELAAAAGWPTELALEDVCPYVDLPGSWDEYLDMLSGKQRHELRRKMRKAARSAKLEIVEAGDPAALDEHLRIFMALHEASTADKADFMRDPRMRELFGLVARAALENDWLDLSFLVVNGQWAASMFCFRYQGAVLVYNSGFDPQAYAGLSPGVVLLGYRIKDAIEAGMREFDFMQGDERYKYDLGGQDRPVRRLFVRRS
jgi:CelD/BcsL family acetyltransferase involved in cellulose biosynthesis